MALDHIFTSARSTTANPAALLAAVRAAVSADVGIREREPGIYRAKKNTDWTPAQITAAQNAIETAPADTPQLQAQQVIDAMPIVLKAILLTMLDEINRLRAGTAPATPITTAQAIATVRAKAGTLT